MANKTKKKPKTKNMKSGKKKAFILVLVFIFIIGAVVALSFYANRGNSAELPEIGKNVAYGIDVSHHNGKIDWSKVKGEIDFAFIRVGYRTYDKGNIYIDSKAKRNLKYANENDIPIGVYFYSQAISEKEAEEEAEFVLKEIKGYDISLPVVIDFEYTFKNGKEVGRLSSSALTKKEKTNVINAFCKKVENAGYIPGVYASSYIYKSHISVSRLDDNVMIWVADYNDEVTYSGDYDFWQFSEKGKCKGVHSKYVDTNYWYIKE